MIFIFVIVLFLIIFLNNFKEKFSNNGEAITGSLSLLDNMNGYVYLVGGDLGGSYTKPGFKEEELKTIIGDLEKYKIIKQANQYKSILKDKTISNEKMVPFLFAAAKEINSNYKKSIEELNKIREEMDPLISEMQKIKACMISLDRKRQCDDKAIGRKDF